MGRLWGLGVGSRGGVSAGWSCTQQIDVCKHRRELAGSSSSRRRFGLTTRPPPVGEDRLIGSGGGPPVKVLGF